MRMSNVIIDFNKSLNPPCVFSIFTTCPVPRKENKLPIKISAGEKNYDGSFILVVSINKFIYY